MRLVCYCGNAIVRTIVLNHTANSASCTSAAPSRERRQFKHWGFQVSIAAQQHLAHKMEKLYKGRNKNLCRAPRASPKFKNRGATF